MPKQFQFYVALAGVLLVSLVVGNAVAERDYFTPVMMLLLCLVIAAIVVPGYGFFLAFGLLCPFAFPIPYVYRFPFLALILGLCCVKFVFSEGLSSQKFHYRFAANAVVGLLFGWVVLRYFMNPVMPGIAIGTGAAITGFRGYLNYAVCLALVLTLPLFIRNREDVVNLLKWLGYVAFSFTLLLIPLTISKSLGAARILTNLGLNVTFFDNGWLRFVNLPWFGLILFTLALLPQLAPLRRWQRAGLIVVAALAIIMGGNRTSLAMAMVILLAVAFVRGKPAFFAAVVVGIAGTLASFYFIGESMSFSRGVGFFRVLALVSPRAAQHSEAAQTFIWRKLRWERAIEDIRSKPWIGMGYGGLKAVFAYATIEDLTQNLIEIDVASGSIHNGYLAGARAFGIPFVVIFAILIATRLYQHAKHARSQRKVSPLQSEFHAFILATLAGLMVAIYLGLDLNSFDLWFYITFGFVVSNMNEMPANPQWTTLVPEEQLAGFAPLAQRRRPVPTR